MNAMLHVVCPHCGAINRLPGAKPGERARCGACRRALFEGKPVALSEADFDRHAAKSDIPLLVDFWAAWCGPCRAMAPVFEQAAARLEPRVRLGKVDTESEPRLAARFAIRSIPTLLLMHKGQEIGRTAGAMPLAGLLAWVTDRLGAASPG